MIYDLDFYMSLNYPVIIKESEYTDGTPSFTAVHPDLPGCRGQGDTREQAQADLAEARRVHLEGLIEDGIEPPLPTVEMSAIPSGDFEIHTVEISSFEFDTKEKEPIVMNVEPKPKLRRVTLSTP